MQRVWKSARVALHLAALAMLVFAVLSMLINVVEFSGLRGLPFLVDKLAYSDTPFDSRLWHESPEPQRADFLHLAAQASRKPAALGKTFNHLTEAAGPDYWPGGFLLGLNCSLASGERSKTRAQDNISADFSSGPPGVELYECQ